VSGRVEAVRGEVADLRAHLEALEAQVGALGTEVRTRRVVVVDARGRPRIVVAAEPGVASVRVDAAGGDPSVELYAVDPIAADGAEVGVALVVDGDVVAGLHVLAAGEPSREVT
jgi:hypothetical protein